MSKAKKKVIYTCITGKYDELLNHDYTDNDWDYICFSDTIQQNDTNSSWRIQPLYYKEGDDTRINRWHKINAHLCLEDYEYSIYIDANIDILSREFFDIIEEHQKSSSTFSVMRHPARDCVYDEYEVCVALNKDDPLIMQSQINIYREQGYPEHRGLYASSILYRKHFDEKIVSVMEEWWKWLESYSRRDQLSLPYVLWLQKYDPDILPFKYGLGKSGPLYFYPHSGNLKAYTRQLYNKAEALIQKQKLLKSSLKEAEARLSLIENSRTWRMRNKLVKFLKK